MSKGIAYRVGQWVGNNPGPTMAIVAVVAIAVYASTAKPVPSAPALPPAAEAVVEEVDPRIEACGPQLESRRAQAKAAAAKKDFLEAYLLMDFCAPRLDKESAEYKEFLSYAMAQAKVVDAQNAAFAKAEKARKKKEGVRIGMSQQDVLDSSWGRPEKINRSTNSYGTREQWVYGGGNYLYFQDGVLTSFQN